MEIATVVALVKFLLAGLVCTVLIGAVAKRGERAAGRVASLLVAGAFLLLAGHYLFDVFNPYLELTDPGRALHLPAPSTLARWLETGAFLLLLVAYRPACPPGQAALAGLALPWPVPAALVNWVLAVALAGTFVRRRGASWFRAAPVLAAALALTCRLLESAGARSGWYVWLWAGDEALMLLSLVLFALVAECQAGSLGIRVVVRLNLIFILIGSVLVLIVTRSERTQLVRLEEGHLSALSELLRGEALRFYREGRPAETILSEPVLVREIVSEFGNIPNLRRVRVRIEDRTMEMAIRPDGVISHAVFVGGGAAAPRGTPVFVGGERVATLARTPIQRAGQVIGAIELDESLAGIDGAVAWQISRVFLAFTALVLLSSGLIGLTIHAASRTIQNQNREIESANRQLLQAAKLASVGELAAGVAHEINNPAGIILARADYLLAVEGTEGAEAETAEGIRVVRHQAERISQIVKGMLSFSRSSPTKVIRVSLNDTLREAMALAEPRCRAARIEVQTQLQETLPAVSIDSNQINQVFVNIFNNAVDAMPNGGRLMVRSGLDGAGQVIVSITDTGPGIAEEHLSRVFDPFFTTKPAGRGTGLGLAISYGIVRRHGGEIHVSTAAGEGTTFTIVLPAEGNDTWKSNAS